MISIRNILRGLALLSMLAFSPWAPAQKHKKPVKPAVSARTGARATKTVSKSHPASKSKAPVSRGRMPVSKSRTPVSKGKNRRSAPTRSELRHAKARTILPQHTYPHRSAPAGTTIGRGITEPQPVYTAPDPVYPAATRPVPPDAAMPEPTGSPFLYAKNLTPFFAALAAHSHSDADASDTIRILQFGDSHTAADLFSGAVRAAMQAHFGDGGLGFQYPGHPFAGYHLAGSSRSQSSGWFTEGNHFTALGDGDLGLGGISIATFRPGQTISVSTTCTTFQLDYLRQPGGGRLRFTDNGAFVSTINTSDREASTEDGSLLPASNATSNAGTFTYTCTAGLHDFTVTTLDSAPVKLFGLVTEQPGVTWECLGLNGAVAPLMLRWNQRLFSEYLRERDPTLIVLAYGTNEAAQGANTNDTYIAQFTRLIDSLHRYAPAAAILVLGPYDRATRVGSRRHSYLATWPGTARIIADQQEACRVHGCAYYNEQTRMGGPGSMIRWASAGLAQPDHTHLTGTGYRQLAQALYDDLLRAYTSYEASHAPTATSAQNP